MEKMVAFLEGNLFNIFLINTVLFNTPSFYILPVKSIIFTSHSTASYFLIISFIFLILKRNLFKDKELSNKNLVDAILLLFIFYSLSVLSAVNIVEFLKVYKNFVFGIMFFFSSAYLINSKERLKKVLTVIILSICLNLIYRFVIFFKPFFLFELFKNILYDKFINFVNVQTFRSRFFIELFDWVYIPIIVFLCFKKKAFFTRFLLIAQTFLLFFFSILSGYRALFLISLFGLLISFLILAKKKYFLTILVSVSIFLILQISFFYLKINAVSRLFNEEIEESSSIESRFKFWQESLIMMESSPFFGVGLGNFYDYLPNKKKIDMSLFNWRKELMKVTLIHPHNNFFATLAETGFVGLVSFLVLIMIFIYYDLKNFKKDLNGFTIISFWLLFLLSMEEPSYVLQYQITFWFLRSLLYKNKKLLLI